MMDLSTVTEPQVIKDGDKIITYEVIKKEVDLSLLRKELSDWLSMEEPSNEDLIEYSRRGEIHPYYEPARQIRIQQIQDILLEWEG